MNKQQEADLDSVLDGYDRRDRATIAANSTPGIAGNAISIPASASSSQR